MQQTERIPAAGHFDRFYRFGARDRFDDEATVERITDLSPTVREFVLRPAAGSRTWMPGSHLVVGVDPAPPTTRDCVPGAAFATRTYSLVDLPQAGTYTIAVKRLAPGRGGSRFMWALSEGDRIPIGGPQNHFPLSFDAPQFLLVAAGIGITPLLGMARGLARKGADLAMRYAARSEPELVYATPLRDVLGARLRTFSSADGQRLDLRAEIAALAPDAQLLACGPLSLLQAARDAWAQAGRPADRLRYETFGASGTRPAEPFWVRVKGRQDRIQVGADSTLLDALNDAGVETLYDCLRGECGLCALDIMEVEGEIDHRDVFLSSEEKRGNRRLCACVSRVAGGGVVIDSGFRDERRLCDTGPVTQTPTNHP